MCDGKCWKDGSEISLCQSNRAKNKVSFIHENVKHNYRLCDKHYKSYLSDIENGGYFGARYRVALMSMTGFFGFVDEEIGEVFDTKKDYHDGFTKENSHFTKTIVKKIGENQNGNRYLVSIKFKDSKNIKCKKSELLRIIENLKSNIDVLETNNKDLLKTINDRDNTIKILNKNNNKLLKNLEQYKIMNTYLNDLLDEKDTYINNVNNKISNLNNYFSK